MDFAGPAFAPLLLAAPLLAFAGWRGLRAGERGLRLFLAEERWKEGIPGFAPSRKRLRLLLCGGALLLASTSLLGPLVGTTEREVLRRGIDVVVALDTSNSMRARDVRPDRLGRAKREIRGLARRLRGDRLALVAFAGDARVVCPLTNDMASFEGFLDEAEPSRNRVGGTDLAAAIRESLRLFDGRTGAHEAIVLLTDGEDQAGEGLAAANEAAGRRIRIFVVGIGSVGGGKIPIEEGGKEAFLTGPGGGEVRTNLDLEGLRKIAQATGGDAVTVESSPAPLDEIYDKRISAIAQREFEGTKRRVPIDRYQWPLAAAFLLGLAGTGLGERRGG
ncbi:MAG TPA: VWA domain-containing protein [Planctomycetota bacterium]|jgi:Ca-activated chloride channel family protein|nr:VWA domain-containing protein [Planctomycetota bacterium]